MKTYLLLLLFMASLSAKAQENIEVFTETREMSKGTNTAFVVNIPQADYKLVELQWRNYVNDRPLGVWLGTGIKKVGNLFRSSENKVATERLRMEKVKDELYLRAITLEDLSQRKMDIYAKIVQMQTGCQLVAFFQFTDSVFITEEIVPGEMFLNLKNYIRDFGVKAYREAVLVELDAAESDMKDKEKELKKLESRNAGFEKSINGFETEISDAESELRFAEGQLRDQDRKMNRMKTERQGYQKRSLDYESISEQLKQEGKAKKEMLSNVKKIKNRISKNKSKTRSEEGKIRQNFDQQELQQKIISDQQMVIDGIKVKLDGIR